MHNKRFQRLAEELALIEVWAALWNSGDEHVRKARQIRREEIVHELSAVICSVRKDSFCIVYVAEA